MAKRSTCIALGGLAFTIVFTALSFLINALLLGEAHEKYTFFRPDDDLRIIPGLGILSLLWGMLVSAGYHHFGLAGEEQASVKHGAQFGLWIFVFFILCQELFYYLFIEFDFIIIAGALIHYGLSFVVSGAAMGWINQRLQAARD